MKEITQYLYYFSWVFFKYNSLANILIRHKIILICFPFIVFRMSRYTVCLYRFCMVDGGFRSFILHRVCHLVHNSFAVTLLLAQLTLRSYSKPHLAHVNIGEFYVNMDIEYMKIIQSHSYITRGNRRLSLAALPGLPAASRGVKLPLLANTRCFLVQFQSNCHAHRRTFVKRRR